MSTHNICCHEVWSDEVGGICASLFKSANKLIYFLIRIKMCPMYMDAPVLHISMKQLLVKIAKEWILTNC